MQTVTSKDGTVIAYEAAGDGPTVVLVGTTAGDHHDLDGLARMLAAGFRVVNYDRRGRGASGDTQPYAPAREVEDLDALLGVVGPGRPPVPAEHLEPMKADPMWEKLTRYAHTLAYDGRIVQGTQDGDLLPRATYRTLPGQDHSALWMNPDAVAAPVAEFLHATAC